MATKATTSGDSDVETRGPSGTTATMVIGICAVAIIGAVVIYVMIPAKSKTNRQRNSKPPPVAWDSVETHAQSDMPPGEAHSEDNAPQVTHPDDEPPKDRHSDNSSYGEEPDVGNRTGPDYDGGAGADKGEKSPPQDQIEEAGGVRKANNSLGDEAREMGQGEHEFNLEGRSGQDELADENGNCNLTKVAIKVRDAWKAIEPVTHKKAVKSFAGTMGPNDMFHVTVPATFKTMRLIAKISALQTDVDIMVSNGTIVLLFGQEFQLQQIMLSHIASHKINSLKSSVTQLVTQIRTNLEKHQLALQALLMEPFNELMSPYLSKYKNSVCLRQQL